MAFNLQSDEGDVDNANAYIDVAFLEAYLSDRGVDHSAHDNSSKEAAIVLATDYLDTRFSFVGSRLLETQSTEWPRDGVLSKRGDCVEGIPTAIRQACAEYAWYALVNDTLFVSPAPNTDGRLVAETSKAVSGAVSKSVRFERGSIARFQEIPVADQRLRSSGFLLNTSRVIRG
jgi:hypothetical protein